MTDFVFSEIHMAKAIDLVQMWSGRVSVDDDPESLKWYAQQGAWSALYLDGQVVTQEDIPVDQL